MSCHAPDATFTVLQMLTGIIRPQLLLRTARIGTLDYARARDLRRILRAPVTPKPGADCLAQLIELEEIHNARRLRPMHEVGSPWRAARHIEVLIALLAEAQLLTATLRPRP
ncbi:DUF6477 family protein [Pararhodobacter oceanensis]|uniref:DUF6477 family protein n=1 Tax=Pararhodobacter oceanensis TaxID=2172121 RepID=UPI003A90A10E